MAPAEMDSGGGELERREQDVVRPAAADDDPPAFPPSGTDEAVFAAEYRAHSGPLPDQHWFAGLEKLYPGATEIILRDFTEERQHQREMQRQALDLDATVVKDFGRYQNTRLWMAGGFALFLAVSGLVLILLDRAVYGFVLLVAEIATLVGVFLAQHVLADDDADLDLTDEEEMKRLAAELAEGEKG